MTGPEHFQCAEELLSSAEEWDATNPEERPYMHLAHAAAQIHATLALAAATALQPSTHSVSSPTYQAWLEVAGERS